MIYRFGKFSTRQKVETFLFRQLSKPPINPHDHAMLEIIYNEMHAARFINLVPLTLLSSTLSLYFTSEYFVRAY